MGKQRIDIERLLVWAFREELPKVTSPRPDLGFGSAWDSVSSYGELLTETIADGVNRYGVVVDGNAATQPHCDALVIGDALEDLRQCNVGMPDNWSVYASGLGLEGREINDCAAQVKASLFVEHMPGVYRMRRGPNALVHKHAILGGCPDWRGQAVKREPMMSRGKPAWFCMKVMTGFAGITYEVEVDGYDAKARRPMKGAYRKYHLLPDPVPVIAERLEYHGWFLGLTNLVSDLSGRLRDYDPHIGNRVMFPWLENN